MSEKTFQAKLTEGELKSALVSVALGVANSANGPIGLNEEDIDRFNYLAKRILKIQKGDLEINNETDENPAPATPKPVGWS